MKPVVKNGEFCIPLYHGTSSLFIDSIQALGLGAVNPIEKEDSVGFITRLLKIADMALGSDEEWKASRFAVEWIVEQRSSRDGLNLQHGDTYLTPSRGSAVGYALTNRFGSELITQAFRVYRLVADRRPEALFDGQLQEHPLLSLFSCAPQPVLVTAQRVPVVAVASEGGGPAQPSIERLQEMWTSIEMGAVINVNFRLLTPLPPGSFSAEFLNPDEEHNPYAW